MEGNKKKQKRPELSDVFVNIDGKLCEVVKTGEVNVNKLFNCIRWDYDGSLYFAFNPEFITTIGW